MERTIFSKQRTSKEGKKFYTYFTTLNKKETGEEVTVQVKFKTECGEPNGAQCPMNIELSKDDCNFVSKMVKYEDAETGEEKEVERRTLWVSNWKEGSPYVDTSLDEFEF